MSVEKSARTYLYRTLIILGILSIVFYALFELRHLIAGPVISIEYPASGATLIESLIELRGKTQNVAYLSLNDRPIYVDSKGQVREPLLLSDGYNVIRIKAKDRFGRQAEERLELLVEPSETATTTDPISSF